MQTPKNSSGISTAGCLEIRRILRGEGGAPSIPPSANDSCVSLTPKEKRQLLLGMSATFILPLGLLAITPSACGCGPDGKLVKNMCLIMQAAEDYKFIHGGNYPGNLDELSAGFAGVGKGHESKKVSLPANPYNACKASCEQIYEQPSKLRDPKTIKPADAGQVLYYVSPDARTIEIVGTTRRGTLMRRSSTQLMILSNIEPNNVR